MSAELTREEVVVFLRERWAFTSWKSLVEVLSDEERERFAKLSPGQRRTVAKLLRGVQERDRFETDVKPEDSAYEFKRVELRLVTYFFKGESTGSSLWLYTTVGRKGDEGTMGEIFSRTHRSIAIGPRGAVTLWNGARWDDIAKKKVALEKNPRGVFAATNTMTI